MKQFSNMTKNQIQLLLILLIVVIAGFSFRFGYQPMHNKAKVVLTQNKELKERLSQLEQKAMKKRIYDKEIKEAKEGLEAIYLKYGVGINPAKSTILVSQLEEETSMKVSNVTFVPQTSIFNTTILDANQVPIASLYTSALSLNFEVSGQGLKDVMSFIHEYPQRMNVKSFNVVYNQESGLLSGAMIIDLYSLLRETATEEAPVISNIEVGSDNIFGTYQTEAPGNQDTSNNQEEPNNQDAPENEE